MAPPHPDANDRPGGAGGAGGPAGAPGASGAPLRSATERLVQTLWFEGVGLAVVTPLYGRVTGAGIGESLTLLAVLSALMMAWSAGFNAAFDWAEWRLVGRVASDRPLGLRALHALAHEATAVLVSCPVIATITGLGWQDALLLDVTLTMTYAAYGYVFHLVFDALRPVRARANERAQRACRPSHG
ncbi:MAG TPA: PACE efflux transporter [Polyangiaceae bacterium]|nr:PACE efflux transporter [Polyangiaceae bacterium]